MTNEIIISIKFKFDLKINEGKKLMKTVRLVLFKFIQSSSFS